MLSTLNSQFVPVNLQSATAVTAYGLNGADAISVDTSLTRALTLDGGSGDDVLEGGIANDTLYGWGGNDRLSGGGGNDSLYGGPGDDRFVFAGASNQGIDSVFEAIGEGTDKLDFTATRLPHLTRTTPSLTGTARQTVLNERQSASPRLQLEPLSGQSLEGVEGFEATQPLAFRNSIRTNEDTIYVFKVADFLYSFVDQAATAITISTLPQHGAVLLNNVAITPGQVIPTSAIFAGQLTYSPPINAYGDDFATIGYKVTANALISEQAILTVDVTAVDDQALIIAPVSVSAPFASAKTFTGVEQIRLNDLDDQGERRRVVIELVTSAAQTPLSLVSAPPSGVHYGFETQDNGIETIDRLWLEGTLADINAALALLQLDPLSVTYDGVYDLNIALGNISTQADRAPYDASRTIRVLKTASNTYPRVTDIYFSNNKLWVSYALSSGVNYGNVTVGVGIHEENGAYSSRTVSLGVTSSSGTVEIPLTTPLPDSAHHLRSIVSTVFGGPPAGFESYSAAFLRTGTYVDAQNRIYIYGTSRQDDLAIKANEWTLNGVSTPFNANSYSRIIVNGSAGADAIIVDPAVTIPVSLYGGSGDDILVGGAGNDTLGGGVGSDVLEGWTGNDTLAGSLPNGSSEVDTLRFAGVQSLGFDQITSAVNDTLDFSGLDYGVGVTVDVQTAKATANYLVASNLGRELRLGLSSNASNTSVIGTKYNDDLRGDLGANQLTGGGGDDYLAGRTGNDTYIFVGEDAQLGTDTVVEAVNAGTDTVDFSGFKRVVGGVIFDLANQSSSYPIGTPNSNIQGAEGLVLNLTQAIQLENLLGSPGNDLLTGNSLANVISGLGGDDVIVTGSGSPKDTLYDGDGNDTYRFVNAGAQIDILADPLSPAIGSDTLDFSALPAGVTVSLANTNRQTQVGVLDLLLASSVTLENVIGTAYNDTLTGNSTANTLVGGNGADTILGGAGDDTIVGGQGNDDLTGEAGADFIQGDEGDDVLRGGDHADTLYGGDGADDLYGGDGIDSLFGGTGIDDYIVATTTESYLSDYIEDEDQSALPGGVSIVGPSGQVNHRPVFDPTHSTYLVRVGEQFQLPLNFSDTDVNQSHSLFIVNRQSGWPQISNGSLYWSPTSNFPAVLGLRDTISVRFVLSDLPLNPFLRISDVAEGLRFDISRSSVGKLPTKTEVQQRVPGQEWTTLSTLIPTTFSQTYVLPHSSSFFDYSQIREYRILDTLGGTLTHSSIVYWQPLTGDFVNLSGVRSGFGGLVQPTLNWTMWGEQPQSISIYRSSNTGANGTVQWNLLTTIPGSQSQYTDSTVQPQFDFGAIYSLVADYGINRLKSTGVIYTGSVGGADASLFIPPVFYNPQTLAVTNRPQFESDFLETAAQGSTIRKWIGLNNDFDRQEIGSSGIPVPDYLATSTSIFNISQDDDRSAFLLGADGYYSSFFGQSVTFLQINGVSIRTLGGSQLVAGSNYTGTNYEFTGIAPSSTKWDVGFTTRLLRGSGTPGTGTTYQPVDSTYGVEITVVDIDLQIAGLSNIDEFQKGALIRGNSDFSKANRDGDTGQLLPDHMKDPDTNQFVFDPNASTDLTPATLTWNAGVHDELQIRFTIPDNVAVWDVTDGPQNARRLVSGELFWAQHNGLELMIEGLDRSKVLASQNQGDFIRVEMVDPMRPSAYVDDDEAKYTVVELDALVDGNRDGVISQSDAADRNLVFWYNTDVDRTYGEFQDNLFGREFYEVGSDLVAPPNYSDHFGEQILVDAGDFSVFSSRDLEDFAGLSLYVDPLLAKSGRVINYSIELSDEKGSGSTVRVNLFKGIAGSNSDADQHVSDYNKADSLLKASPRSLVSLYQSTQLPQGSLGEGHNSFLFEALAGVINPESLRDLRPDNDVRLRLNAEIDLGNGNTQTISSSDLFLNLRDITKFYNVFEVQTTDPVTGVDQRSNPNVIAFDRYKKTNVASVVTEEKYSPFGPKNDYLLFVHGWNMSPEWKRAYSDTVTKRLYWAGYQGEIGMVNWPTFWDNGIDIAGGVGPDIVDGLWDRSYNASDFNAYRSAPAITAILEDLNLYGEKPSILAHSMGNVVVGEALRLWAQRHPGEQAVDAYIALEGAMAADAYGETSSATSPDNYYATWPSNSNSTAGPHMFAGIGLTVSDWVNVYNPDDSALRSWRQNNFVKRPGGMLAVGAEWSYLYRKNRDLFGNITSTTRIPDDEPLAEIPLSFIDATGDIKNAYEILAFTAFSDVGPIGSQEVSGWSNLKLADFGYSPTMPGGLDVPNHSYPFHYEIQTTLPFWKMVSDRM